MAGSAIYLDIDISDAKKTIDALRAVHTEHEMNQLLYRAFKRTGGRVKTILRQEIPQDYAAPSAADSRPAAALTAGTPHAASVTRSTPRS